MDQSDAPLAHLKIAASCTADWDQMPSFNRDRVRFCSQCNLNVYNLSAMTRDEARALVYQTEGRLCEGFYRRSDGTFLTENCPVGQRVIKRRKAWLVRVLLGLLVTALSITGLLAFLSRPLAVRQSVVQSKNEDCSGVQFIIEEQPGAPARLAIKETKCKSPYTRDVELTLTNTSAKIIKSYEVEYLDTFERRKDSRTAQGVRGPEIGPGGSVKILVSGGISGGFSYGKPVGPLQKVVFRIKYIGFTDDKDWGQTLSQNLKVR